MNKEKGVIFLTSLVALGILSIATSVCYLQSIVVLPLIIVGIIAFILILYVNKGNIAHKIESLEKVFFIITFLIILISFILLYRPI